MKVNQQECWKKNDNHTERHTFVNDNDQFAVWNTRLTSKNVQMTTKHLCVFHLNVGICVWNTVPNIEDLLI